MQTRFKEQTQPATAPIADEKDVTKKRIIELSLKYKILSPHTAFVGVEKRQNASDAGMVLREVPIEISADDQHLQPALRMSNFNMAPMACMAGAMSAKIFSPSSSLGFGTVGPVGALAAEAAGAAAAAGAAVGVVLASSFGLDPTMNMSRGAMSVIPASNVVDKLGSNCDEEVCSAIASPLSFKHTKIHEDVWPTGDENIVRYLISKQKFDGIWNLDAKHIEKLTGKPLTGFPQCRDDQLLITAIVVVTLETRFGSLSTMWHGVVQKARKRLIGLLGSDVERLDALFAEIRQRS